MRELQTLYLKEIKEQRAAFIFILVGTALAAIVSVSSIGESSGSTTTELSMGGTTFTTDYNWSAHVLWVITPYLLVFVLPLLFLHSFAQEVKGQTHYLLLSLPVRRSSVFLCKLASLVSVGVAVYILATAAVSIVYIRAMEIAAHFTGLSVTRIAVSDLWFLAGNGYFSTLFLCLGIASGIAGLRLIVRRLQGLSAAMFTGVALYVYGRFFEGATNLLTAVLGEHQVTAFAKGQSSLFSSGRNEAVYTILFGAALIALGAWIYEKRAEV